MPFMRKPEGSWPAQLLKSTLDVISWGAGGGQIPNFTNSISSGWVVLDSILFDFPRDFSRQQKWTINTALGKQRSHQEAWVFFSVAHEPSDLQDWTDVGVESLFSMKDKSIWRTLHCPQQHPRDNSVTEFYGQHKLIPYSVTFLKMSRTWAQRGYCPISKCRQDILWPWRQTCNTNQLYHGPSPPAFCSDLPPPFLQPNVSLPYKDSCLALKLASLSSNTHLHFQNVLPAAGQRYNCTCFPGA